MYQPDESNLFATMLCVLTTSRLNDFSFNTLANNSSKFFRYRHYTSVFFGLMLVPDATSLVGSSYSKIVQQTLAFLQVILLKLLLFNMLPILYIVRLHSKFTDATGG